MNNNDFAREWLDVYRDLSTHIEARIDNQLELLTNSYEKAVDRLIGIATQFTILFLTGWVALFAASKLPSIHEHRCFIGFCCLLHVIALFILVLNQWCVLRLYDRRSSSLLESRVKIRTGALEIQRWIVKNANEASSMGFQERVAEEEQRALKHFNNHEIDSANEYSERNRINWQLAFGALGMFFISVIVSLAALISLVHE